MIQPQKTIQFKTYLKTALVDALQSTFDVHPDTRLRDVKVRTEFSFEEVDYPLIVVGYFGRDVQNAGVGHRELIWNEELGRYSKHKRRLYHGDLEFRIYALSTLDRDIISDALVEIIGLNQITDYTNYFMARLYDPEEWQGNVGMSDEDLGEAYLYTLVNVDTDNMTDLGDSASPAPWQPEDVYLYMGGYRLAAMGDVISLPPSIFYTIIEKVLAYPYIGGLEPIPPGTDDPAPWVQG